MAVAVLLRIPWLGVPLGNDEGGLAYIAGAWHDDGRFLYGDYFIDRPPVLLLLYRIAAVTGGTATVRSMGVLAVLALVAVTTVLARDIAGDRAAGWAAAITATLGSSAAIGSVFTPTELLAVVPSAFSVLLLWRGVRGPAPRPALLAAAGALAVCALLVKQSFGDALLAGIVGLAATALLERAGWRAVARAAGAYAGGMLGAIGALEIWELAAGIPDGSMSYALLGFRLDGLNALAASGSGLVGRFSERLLLPLILSGFLLVLCWSARGMRELPGGRGSGLIVSAWGLGGSIGVMAGGSYWAHYLIQLIPFAAVTASAALARASTRATRMTAATLAACMIGGAAIGPSTVTQEGAPARTIGTYLKANAQRGDTVHVLYSQADVLYYSALRDPFPYNWSLMMRTVPTAQAELRSMLAASDRPTWIVGWEPLDSYDLDQDGKTRRLLELHYRQVSRVCGTPVLLRDGAKRSLQVPPALTCG